jgi:hypothetical protein
VFSVSPFSHSYSYLYAKNQIPNTKRSNHLPIDWMIMQPIYFPFTYVADSVAENLAACFKQITVYQPLPDKLPEAMQPWVRKGILNIRVPAKEDNEEIERATQEYLNWANLHQNGAAVKAAFISEKNRAESFADHLSSSHLVAEIKDHVYGRTPSKEPLNLFRARVFLYFAQQYDRQRQSISDDLKACQDQENELMQALKKEADGLVANFTAGQAVDLVDSAAYMPTGRLDAWAQLCLKDSFDSALFVTTSRSILEEVIDRTPTIENIGCWESIPLTADASCEMDAWRDQLISDLCRIAETRWSAFKDGFTNPPEMPGADRGVSLEIYVIPDCDPRGFLRRCTGVDLNRDEKMPNSTQYHNTFIGIIET